MTDAELRGNELIHSQKGYSADAGYSCYCKKENLLRYIYCFFPLPSHNSPSIINLSCSLLLKVEDKVALVLPS